MQQQKAAWKKGLCADRGISQTNAEPANQMGPEARTAVPWAKENECYLQHRMFCTQAEVVSKGQMRVEDGWPSPE